MKTGARQTLTQEAFLAREIHRFKNSQRRKSMVDGEQYYVGNQAILSRKRTVIGEAGVLTPVENLPNNRIVDNQYKKMVDQKCNYLLGQPLSVQSDNPLYAKHMKHILSKKFLRLMKNIGEDALNNGLGWLYLYYDHMGHLAFKRFYPQEIIAGWRDAQHTVLDYAIRIYEVIHFQGEREEIVEKVELYDDKGITFYERHNHKIIPCAPFHQDYYAIDNQSYNWSKIPLIAFKYNAKEIPLINMVKSLQDGLNLIESNFQNQMEEDPRNTILVLVNYDGENLGEFRKNLATYGAVKVRSEGGSHGDLKTLQVQVNAENYRVIIQLFKKAIIENAMGYDAKDERMAGNPNQMNIQSMYCDIDLDANTMETEFQASFEELFWFINAHLYNFGLGDFEGEDVSIIFNRDILINESEIINNCGKSNGMLSEKTILANHPWVDDWQGELDRLAAQNQADLDHYGTPFQQTSLPKNTISQQESGEVNEPQ